MKKNLSLIALSVVATMLLSGCRETVDTTARYVYQNYTISDYLRRHTQYSTYYDLLFQTPVSPITQTNVGQLLSARGHYTVFPPTNDAIQAYLLKLQADGIIAERQARLYPLPGGDE